MKIYGYENSDQEEPKLLELSEVSLSASPSKLRDIANFLNNMANDMDKNDSFEHAHLQDDWADWQVGFPDIIVCSE